MSIIDDEYCREVSNAYFEEEEEMRLGIHPSQILDSVENELCKRNIKGKVTFMDYANYTGHNVGVSLNGEFFGVYNYDEDVFESMPSKYMKI